MATPIAANKIQIDVSLLNALSPSEMADLKKRSIDSSGIDSVQDWTQALAMMANELDELGNSVDLNNAPSIMKDGINYFMAVSHEVEERKNAGTLDEFTAEEGERMINNILSLRKERVYQQEGLDHELNIANESDEIDEMQQD